MSDYPFGERLARGSYYTVVELAVDTGVPDILDFVITADYMTSNGHEIARISHVADREPIEA
jgi:hypothetical protein